MGARNPDNVPMAVWRGGCETVEQMALRHWDVIAQCQVPHCRLEMRVDLTTLIVMRGSAFSLWNKAGRCRRLRCDGAVHFLARPPGCSRHRRLEAPWPDGRPAKGDSGYQGPR